MIDFDGRLEPKVRRREQEEIDEIVRDEYHKFLSGLSNHELFAKFLPVDVKNAREALIELIIEVDDLGKRDKDFQKQVDWEEISWETT